MTSYNSKKTISSEALAGVSFTIRRMSFGRRIELAKQVRELVTKLQFHKAGKDAADQIESAVLQGEVERAYILWGLDAIDGITIDGAGPTAESLVEQGPEGLCREVSSAIRAECQLSEEERKN